MLSGIARWLGLSRASEYVRVDWRTWISVIVEIVRNELLNWSAFTTSFLLSIVSIIANAFVIYFMVGFVQPYASSRLQAYGGSLAAYIIIGLIFHSIIRNSYRSYYEAISGGYWSAQLEQYHASPIGVGAYVAGYVIFSFITSLIVTLIYLCVGVFVFQLDLSRGSPILLILILALSIFSLTGVGLVSASSFILLNAKGGNPVNWIMDLLTDVFAGLYFPTDMLGGLQALSFLIPQTYSFDAARMVILHGFGFNELTLLFPNLLPLLIWGATTLPIGALLWREAIRKAEREGSLSRWT